MYQITYCALIFAAWIKLEFVLFICR